MNVDLDEPLERRRAEIERLREVHGRLEVDPDEPATSFSSFDRTWWCEGERGRVRVEMLLSPEPEPRIQALNLTSAPEPPTGPGGSRGRRRRGDLGRTVGRRCPTTLADALAPAVDQVALERAIRAAGARFGPVTPRAGHGRLRDLGDMAPSRRSRRSDPPPGARPGHRDMPAVELQTVDTEPPILAD